MSVTVCLCALYTIYLMASSALSLPTQQVGLYLLYCRTRSSDSAQGHIVGCTTNQCVRPESDLLRISALKAFDAWSFLFNRVLPTDILSRSYGAVYGHILMNQHQLKISWLRYSWKHDLLSQHAGFLYSEQPRECELVCCTGGWQNAWSYNGPVLIKRHPSSNFPTKRGVENFSLLPTDGHFHHI